MILITSVLPHVGIILYLNFVKLFLNYFLKSGEVSFVSYFIPKFLNKLKRELHRIVFPLSIN